MSEPENPNNLEAVPFFARYLEGQNIEELSEEEMEEIGGSLTIAARATGKYPSDRDEVLITLKHPSDREDITSKIKDTCMLP